MAEFNEVLENVTENSEIVTDIPKQEVIDAITQATEGTGLSKGAVAIGVAAGVGVTAIIGGITYGVTRLTKRTKDDEPKKPRKKLFGKKKQEVVDGEAHEVEESEDDIDDAAEEKTVKKNKK